MTPFEPDKHKVAGVCPMGCGESLWLVGDTVMCLARECPRMMAAAELLNLSPEHFVTFDEWGFTIEHPVRERIEGTTHDCPLDRDLRAAEWPPVPPGRYVVKPRQQHPASEALRSGALAWNYTRVGV
jgi:hypothetical protein